MFSVDIHKMPRWFLNTFLLFVIFSILIILTLSVKVFFWPDSNLIIFGKEFGFTQMGDSEKGNDFFSLKRLDRKGVDHSKCVSISEELIDSAGYNKRRSGKGFWADYDNGSFYIYCPLHDKDEYVTLVFRSADTDTIASVSREVISDLKNRLESSKVSRKSYPYYSWETYDTVKHGIGRLTKKECNSISKNIFNKVGLENIKKNNNQIMFESKGDGYRYQIICDEYLIFMNVFSSYKFEDEMTKFISARDEVLKEEIIDNKKRKEIKKINPNLGVKHKVMGFNNPNVSECIDFVENFMIEKNLEVKGKVSGTIVASNDGYLLRVSCIKKGVENISYIFMISPYNHLDNFHGSIKEFWDEIDGKVKIFNEENKANDPIALSNSIFHSNAHSINECINMLRSSVSGIDEKHISEKVEKGSIYVRTDKVVIYLTCNKRIEGEGYTIFASASSVNYNLLDYSYLPVRNKIESMLEK